jgi:hypothetical protein
LPMPLQLKDARLDTACPIGKLPTYVPIAEMARIERNRTGVCLFSIC